MLGGGNDPRVGCILIRIERGLLLIHGGNLLPQGLSALATAVANVEGKDLASRSIHGNPYPLSVLFVPHKAPELVQLGLQPLQDHGRGACRWLDVKMLGGCPELFNPELQEPSEPHTHRTTNPTWRDALQQQSFNKGS